MTLIQWEGQGSGTLFMSLPGFSYCQDDRCVNEPTYNTWSIDTITLTYDTLIGLLESHITTLPNQDCSFGAFECPEQLSSAFELRTSSDGPVEDENQPFVFDQNYAIQGNIKRAGATEILAPYTSALDLTNSLYVSNNSYQDYNEGLGFRHPTYGSIMPDYWIDWSGQFRVVHTPEVSSGLLLIVFIISAAWRGVVRAGMVR